MHSAGRPATHWPAICMTCAVRDRTQRPKSYLPRGTQALPREMNRRWDGSEDYEQPSTLLSRICAGITLEAAGVLLTLPYQEMSASSGGSADRVIWRMPVPVQPGVRERFVAAAAARRARPDAPPPGPRRFTY